MVKVTDKDLGSDTATFTVTVANVPPTVTAPVNQSANEGASTSFSLGSFSDPGLNDKPWIVDIDWGDATAHGGASLMTQGTIPAQSHAFADNGSYTVTVKVTDKDRGYASSSFTVAVANVAPTATLANNGPVDEGSPATISFSGQHDPSNADTAAGFHYAYHCDGSVFAAAPLYATSGTSATNTCTFADNGTYTVRARIIDKDVGYSEDTTAVTVNNVPPTGTAPGNPSANEGASTSFSLGSFSDPGLNDTPWAVDVNWGDGSSHTTFNAATQGALMAKYHTYADDGRYTRLVNITDKDPDDGFGT